MKRTLALLAFLATTFGSLAMGPKIMCMITWVDSVTPGVTGYRIYWRTNNGSYSDLQSIGVSSSQKPVDLRNLGLQKGQYFVVMTAVAPTSESPPSTPETPWDYTNPNGPSQVTISPR